VSHFSEIETEITDIQALREVVKAMGFELVENGVVRGWGSNKTTADYVIKLPDGYDVGFVRKGNRYKAVADLWNNHVEKYMGKGLSRLKKEYARRFILRRAREKGYSVIKNNENYIELMTPEGATIKFSIDETGNYTVHVTGAPGGQCLNLTEPFETGRAKRAFTDEYYRTNERIRVGVDGSNLCG